MRSLLSRPLSPRQLGALAALAAWGLALVNTAFWMQGDLEDLRPGRRYWEDLAIAASRYLAAPGSKDAPALSVGTWEGSTQARAYQRQVLREVKRLGIRHWELWRTIPMERHRGRPLLSGRPSDDVGRARYTAAAFRVAGGVAPLLVLWLPVLVSLPVLGWAALELTVAGRPVAGAVFPALIASSAFAVEAMALPYSASGFYVLGVPTLVALGAYAVLGRPRPTGLLIRTAAAGVVFALLVLGRAPTILQAPGFLLVLLVGAMRLPSPADGRPPDQRRRWLRGGAIAALLGALFLTPYLALRPVEQHEVWLGLWEGLGDFDREKGHHWWDPVAKQTLREAGFEAPSEKAVWERAMEYEEFFRARVIENVLGDPAWYARILLKRLQATVLMSKLRPWRQADGRTFALATTVNEGAMDAYYSLVTTVDVFGVAPLRYEVPVALLQGASGLLLLAWAGGRLVPRVASGTRGLSGPIGLVGCLAVGALGSPVLVTTASGIEPQCFAFVHLLSFALLADLVARAARDALRGEHAPPPPGPTTA